jgi:hypothetical protein
MTLHDEKRLTARGPVRGSVIGISDGVTVPFSLVAGLTGKQVTQND